MKLQFGIIGFGRHAHRCMVPAFEDALHTELHAIGTSSIQKEKEIHSLLPTLRTYTSYEKLLTDSNIDAVYIGLPNHLHKEWSCKALQAQKHVLCDKPLGLTPIEVNDILSESATQQRYVVEGFMYRFHPQHQVVKNLLAENAIGEIQKFNAHFSYFLDDTSNIRLQPACGGGALYDIGCYTIDICSFLFPGEIDVQEVNSIIGKTNVDVQTEFSAQLQNGITANLFCSMISERKSSYQIIGSEGHIIVPDAFHVPRNKKTVVELKNKMGTKYIKVGQYNHFALELDAFAQMVHNNTPNPLFNTPHINASVIEAVRSKMRIVRVL